MSRLQVADLEEAAGEGTCIYMEGLQEFAALREKTAICATCQRYEEIGNLCGFHFVPTMPRATCNEWTPERRFI